MRADLNLIGDFQKARKYRPLPSIIKKNPADKNHKIIPNNKAKCRHGK